MEVKDRQKKQKSKLSNVYLYDSEANKNEIMCELVRVCIAI